MIGLLPPLPVAGPLAVAGLLLVFSHALPRRVPDLIAILTAIAAVAVCIVMAAHTAAHPLVYWFGGWAPQQGQVLGIGFVVDQAGAAVAAFIGVLFAASMVLAWGFYDEVHAHFHVLMLLFMAGMVGFCLTHDLFNLFVWFEVMSIAAFALTGYELRSSALDAALNFTVVNTIGSYLILAGIGLIYARTGALDFSALERGVAAAPDDVIVAASFVLLATGLLIKAAQVPFQFWLPDAHAVAPSPASVIFSGAMVGLGLFGVARLTWTVFAPSDAVQHVVHTLLLWMGAGSAVLGGAMALIQRQIKRLLAFSTISHTGVMLIGLALLNPTGLCGMLVYLVGHGLVKGALFMLAGIVLATCGGIDEIGLRGQGRRIWPAGIAMVSGGLLLAGLPLGLMHEGTQRIEAAAHQAGADWLLLAVLAAEACTGGAVLRVVGRVFLGLGQVPGEEDHAPTDEERETADRPLWGMLAPTAFLLALALIDAPGLNQFAASAAAAFMHPDVHAILGAGAGQAEQVATAPASLPQASWLGLLSVFLALVIAGYQLTRRSLPRVLAAPIDSGATVLSRMLNRIHSGLIGDYVTWLMAGLVLFALAFAFS